MIIIAVVTGEVFRTKEWARAVFTACDCIGGNLTFRIFFLLVTLKWPACSGASFGLADDESKKLGGAWPQSSPEYGGSHIQV